MSRRKYQRTHRRKRRREKPEHLNRIQREWWKTLDPASKKLKALVYNLKRRYGITLEQYQELYDKQVGCCHICQRHADQFAHRLHVDHNHKTQEVRGLLCWSCNRELIGKHTDPAMFRKAAEYLEAAHTGWFAPIKPRKKRRRKKKT